jgi:integral membrane protein
MNVQALRFVGTLEGISFLLLLGVAMPIKYIWGNPVLVKYIGMGHGVLFVLFLVMLLVVCHRMKWSLSIFNLGLIAAILPFGPFIFDRKVKQLAEKDHSALIAE